MLGCSEQWLMKQRKDLMVLPKALLHVNWNELVAMRLGIRVMVWPLVAKKRMSFCMEVAVRKGKGNNLLLCPGGGVGPSWKEPELQLVLLALVDTAPAQLHRRKLLDWPFDPKLVLGPFALSWVLLQHYPDIFNRASLFNAGFFEARRMEQKFDCFVFHDVDITPEDGRMMYTCDFAPLHIGAYLSKFNYK